ncbi:MAG: IPT/TIG domain-containing protein [Acidobacteriota bacterium]
MARAFRFRARVITAAGILAAAFALGRCGGSPSGPSPQVPSLTSITPSRGPASGGTTLRISGINFSGAAVVVLGGVSATEVTVESPTSIVAKTAPRSAGTVDVAVTVAGRSLVLAGAFQYEIVQSAPPVVTSIVARGARTNEPAGFADLNEEITVTASVQDSDTPPDQLIYEWAAPAGTFSGTGASVKWRAPAAAAVPTALTLTLAVIDPANRVTAATTISLHDSVKEVGDLARLFLLDFSDSTITSPDVVLRNFSRSARCSKPRQNEFEDVVKNREHYRIESSLIEPAVVNFQFGGRPCRVGTAEGDGCAAVPATWQSLCLKTFDECTAGDRPRVTGIDYVAAVYEESSWRLCASAFGSRDGISRPNFIR